MIILKKIINKLIEYRVIRFFLKFSTPKYIILYYHGVISDKEFFKLSGPNQNLYVSVSNFKKQVDLIKKKKIDVISLDELYKENFKPKNFSIVFTFDDGYKDNFKNVYPILKEKNYPFIIYLISIFIEDNAFKWSWWLEVWKLIMKKESILFEGKKIRLNTTEEKKIFFSQMKMKLKKLNYKDQQKEVTTLFNLSSLQNFESSFLNNDEINYLLKDPLVSIGSHGHEHLSYKNFDNNTQYNDAMKSRSIIQNKFNKNVEHFSYPYGNTEDITHQEYIFLKKIGYKTAVTTFDYSHKKFNPFYLCRYSIGPNVDIVDFERKLLGVDSFLRKIFFR